MRRDISLNKKISIEKKCSAIAAEFICIFHRVQVKIPGISGNIKNYLKCMWLEKSSKDQGDFHPRL